VGEVAFPPVRQLVRGDWIFFFFLFSHSDGPSARCRISEVFSPDGWF
jgi:hypothetical protein